MASSTCWLCEDRAHMTRFTPVRSVRIERASYLVAGFLCDGCGAPGVGMLHYELNPRFDADGADVLDRSTDILWFPPKARGKQFPDVPAHIAQAANEAHECADIRAWRAAVLMARAVIEASAKEKGVTSGTLLGKIDALYEQRHIREHIKDGAHEVRLFGNDMAHGDFTEDVSPEEGDLVLTLMGEVLDEVFQSPARVERARKAREVRKEA